MAYQVGTSPNWNYWRANLSTSNVIAAEVSVPERVRVLQIGCFLAGSSGQAAQLVLCVWDANRNLRGRSGQFGSAPGAGSSGGQRWTWAAPQAETILTAGAYWVGWWRSELTWGEFSYQSGTGTFLDQTSAGVPGSLGGTAQSGAIGRLLQVESAPVTPPLVETAVGRVWDAVQGQWVAVNAQVWDAVQGRWVDCRAEVWDATRAQWVQTGPG